MAGSNVDPFAGEFNPKCTLHAESPGAAHDDFVKAHAEASNRMAQDAAPPAGADTGMAVEAPSDQDPAGGHGAEGGAPMSSGVAGGAGLIFGALFVRTPT